MPVSEQGANFDRYMLVPRTLIFLVRGTSVLLIRGAPTKRLWAGLYNGIGGHVEPGEDVLSAAKRELAEETGLESDDLFLCGVVTIDTQKNPGVGVYVFKGSSSKGELISSSEGSLEWIQISDLNKIPVVADLPVLLTKILAEEAGNHPFSAHSWYDDAGKMIITFG